MLNYTLVTPTKNLIMQSFSKTLLKLNLTLRLVRSRYLSKDSEEKSCLLTSKL